MTLLAVPTDDLGARLARLPTVYSHWDVIELVFHGDEHAYADAWIHGRLPSTVRRECHTSMDPVWFQSLLLMRVSQQLARLSTQMTDLIAVVSEPVGGYPAPEPEP